MNASLRIVTFAATALVAVSAHALTFTNFVYSGSLSKGIAQTNSGNSISFTTPNAFVGDPDLASSRSGSFTIQYDAHGGKSLGQTSVAVNSTILGALLGRGTIVFQEDIFELDSMGNEVGSGPIASLSQTLDASSPSWSSTATFSRSAENLRAKKSFTLLAPDSATPSTIDFASVGLVNQSFNAVPEPTSFAVMGLGLIGLLRRRASAKRRA